MIIIRKARKGDVRGIARMFNENLRNKFFSCTGTNKLFTKKKINKWERGFADNGRGRCTFVAVDAEKCRIAGHSGFHAGKGRTRHRIDLGWMVHKDYAGQGIATRMVSALLTEAKKRGFKKAEAEAAVVNVSSVKLAKKLGFKIEGKKERSLLLDNGKYVDTYIFGKILK